MRWATVLFLCSCSARIAFPPIEEHAVDVLPFSFTVGPWNGKFEQRWILERGGTETVFTAYLKVTAPDGMHMVAVGDLGGTLCDVTLSEVTQESRMLPGRLGQQMLRDIRPLFQPLPEHVYQPVLAGGEPGLYYENGDDRVLWTESALWTTYAKVYVKRWHEATASLIKIQGRYHATVETKEIEGP